MGRVQSKPCLASFEPGREHGKVTLTRDDVAFLAAQMESYLRER